MKQKGTYKVVAATVIRQVRTCYTSKLHISSIARPEVNFNIIYIPQIAEKGQAMKKTLLDDRFYPYLTEGAEFVGDAGIPMLLDLKNTQIPRALLPFEKIHSKKFDKRRYVHFYMHDKYFSRVLTSTTKYLDDLKMFDGVITPDCTMLIGQSRCLLETNTYFNRAVGYYLQKQRIPVIPNIRWSDKESYEFCFLGVPQKSIVSISTHGCIRSKEQKAIFKDGLEEMLKRLEPSTVIVHGYMPNDIFGDYLSETDFRRYPSLFEESDVKSAFVEGNLVDTPVNGLIDKIKVVNEHQQIFINGDLKYDVWLTRGIVIFVEGREISFEKDIVPFSEEINIHRGYDLINTFGSEEGFTDGWDDNVTAKVERDITIIG